MGCRDRSRDREIGATSSAGAYLRPEQLPPPATRIHLLDTTLPSHPEEAWEGSYAERSVHTPRRKKTPQGDQLQLLLRIWLLHLSVSTPRSWVLNTIPGIHPNEGRG
eukprot:GHVU01025213.1.p2 GENE.GHVU01025213.1~~GHVU01025213.1.p2  ORF type:complete len:107 (-),score=7.29 GHVU01025213.1:58-378(-)